MIVITLLALILSTSVISPARAQQCDDFDSCTANDMCADGVCNGTPASGGSCDDGNACTVNDTCVAGTCTGTPAPTGASCNGGCGLCQEIAPGFPPFCLPDVEKTGHSCDDNFACTDNDVCQSGFCFGTFRQCPDSDGNPCTADVCNPQTGQCQATNFPPCAPCQTCRATGSTHACDPALNGTACDDFDECTASSMCSGGACVEGIPIGPTPTATTVVAPPTATATQPVPTATQPRPTATQPPPTATQPPPTATQPPPTATQPPPTATQPPPTATQPPPTATSGVPTSTPGGIACVGDCGNDGQVSVDEIVRAVNIALGNLTTNECQRSDGNSDGFVTVDEIVSAVNNALNGCG